MSSPRPDSTHDGLPRTSRAGSPIETMDREPTPVAEEEPPELLSVGKVSAETGLTPDTLRMWERRYGAPVPRRRQSGHRRYTVEQLHWLRRIAEGISLGYRPGRLIRSSEEELEAILATAGPRADTSEEVRTWIELIGGMRDEELRRSLLEAGREHDPTAFVCDHLSPLLREIGRCWADGELDVRHEHFATQVIEDTLSTLRDEVRCLPGSAEPGPVVLATLPGEAHKIGLDMACYVTLAQGADPRSLGTEVPPSEILSAVREVRASAVAISVSQNGSSLQTDRELTELRSALPDDVALIVGGAGIQRVRRRRPGIEYLVTLREYARWLADRLSGDETAP